MGSHFKKIAACTVLLAPVCEEVDYDVAQLMDVVLVSDTLVTSCLACRGINTGISRLVPTDVGF